MRFRGRGIEPSPLVMSVVSESSSESIGLKTGEVTGSSDVRSSLILRCLRIGLYRASPLERRG